MYRRPVHNVYSRDASGRTCFSSSDYGYSGTHLASPDSTRVDRFAFASDGNATDWGSLTIGKNHAGGTSSTSYGYGHGGDLGPSYTNVIDKVGFAAGGTGSDVGDLTAARAYIGTTGSNGR